jgi:prepilin-type processing-associated H-X9-DG protein
VIFDGIAQDCVTKLPGTSVAQNFYGDENTVGLRHGRGRTANVLFADFHASNVSQPYYMYESGTKATIYNTWYYEFVGTSAGATQRGSPTAARNPLQELQWDWRRVNR